MKEQDFAVRWFNLEFYPHQSRTARAVLYEEKILPRLHASEITLFTPWGPRYDWAKRGVTIKADDREIRALEFFSGLYRKLSDHMPGKNFHWIFLGADLYGTKINNLPVAAVSDYFSNLAGWLTKILPAAEFQLWSGWSDEAEAYRAAIRADFHSLVSERLLANAERTAQGMGLGSSPQEYLVERLAEAKFMEDIFQPIKISAVRREKDDGADLDLPRLYLLPEALQASWMPVRPPNSQSQNEREN